MSLMMKDDMTTQSFNLSKEKKRLAKMLAAKLDLPDVTALMNYLLDREIGRNFSSETQRELLSGPEGVPEDHEDGEARPKADRRRQAKKPKAA